MLIKELEDKGLIHPPKWLSSNVHYLSLMGSQAYGTTHEESDFDIYGWVINPKESIFPHLANKILGFDPDYKTFDQWQEHHILDKDALGGKGREYDFSIYGIVRYFRLLTDNNPNIVDSIFTPLTCVLHSTKIANEVRANRKIFLHKGAYHKFKGYAFSQCSRINKEKSKELKNIEQFEQKYSLQSTLTFKDVETEMKKRNLL